ncbi:MAG: DUF29 domain-containing protein [Acetobacteraceae bacterium]
MSDLYDTDILIWSEQQAALLRRLANNERINDQVDWENVVEEIESVGRNELRAVESALVQALLHRLKAEAWPLARDRSHWEAEARRAHDEAVAGFTASIGKKLRLDQLYRRALRAMPESYDGQPPLPVPAECTMTLEELLGED